MKFTILAAMMAAGTQAYGLNRCRDFKEGQLVEDFDLDDFSGQWFPLYQSESREVQG